MKRHVFIFTLLLCATFLWAQVSSKPAELDIYNNLNIYSNAGYYPGVVVQAELLENNYPESVFIVEARIAKGQALTILKCSSWGLPTSAAGVPVCALWVRRQEGVAGRRRGS